MKQAPFVFPNGIMRRDVQRVRLFFYNLGRKLSKYRNQVNEFNWQDEVGTYIETSSRVSQFILLVFFKFGHLSNNKIKFPV